MACVICYSFFIHLKYDRNQYWYYVPNLIFPTRGGRENEYLKETLMDGELVLDIDVNKKTWRYLIFDLMVVNGSTILQRSFNTRLGMLQQDVIQPFKASIRTVDSTKLPPFTVELKKMERAYGLHLVFDQLPKLKHKSDGIIWTPVKYGYTLGTCEKLLKWKPPELNTADFRISARWSKEHKPIYAIEVLSNGVTYKFYDHFQPEPSLATEWKSHLPEGRIAEFRYDPLCEVTIIEPGYAPTTRKGGWRFVRFRDDKTTANDESIVKKVMHNTQEGVTKEQLLSCMERVRAAWKAREKGIPMPPLSFTTPTTTTISTPIAVSPVMFSPNQQAGYFHSISESNTKRKSSKSEDMSNTTIPNKEAEQEEDVRGKRIKNNTIEDTNHKPTLSIQTMPKNIQSAPPSFQSPPSSSRGTEESSSPIYRLIHRHSSSSVNQEPVQDTRTTSAPTVIQKQSSIRDLLTTSVEPYHSNYVQKQPYGHEPPSYNPHGQQVAPPPSILYRPNPTSPPPPPPPSSSSPSNWKNNQKAKLDFILN
ncbi:mRNA capping enzyme, catalytic domain-containing protein [Choanephora cucurbitarum]|nr:mRNA capping enzyme, catalytic domain-containing protein [Choanephora cucurbitarum]